MKYFALSAVAAFFFAASVTTQAQVNLVSGEPRAETIPGSEEAVVLPSQSSASAKAVLDPEEPIIKNVCQKRDKKMGRMVNGYYKMEGSRDWGTNARLNGYGYETFAASPSTYDMPIYPAGVNEEGTTTESTTTVTDSDSWGSTEAPAKTEKKKEKAKKPEYSW